MSTRLALSITAACMFSAALVAPARVWAGGVCRAAVVANQTTVNQATVTQATFTVVPFAVPVAVPVATFASPAVLYSYQQQAAVANTPAVPATVKATSLSLEPAAILSRHCADCHRAPHAQGQLTLFGADGMLLDKLPRHVIVDSVIADDQGAAKMPPVGRSRLTAEEVRALRRWTTLSRDVVF